MNERRGALAQRDDGRGSGNRKKFTITVDDTSIVERLVHEKASICNKSGVPFTQGSAASSSAVFFIGP